MSAAAVGDPTPTPAPAGEASPPNNLPKQRTHFIGRERELAECARLLGDSRVLTLTGIGGCGKTRLALKLADGMLPTFPDGVWFVDLAPVTDGSRVAEAVAATLGIREVAGTDLLASVCEHVAAKRTLIVLDNCEHVLDEACRVADARAECGRRRAAADHQSRGARDRR